MTYSPGSPRRILRRALAGIFITNALCALVACQSPFSYDDSTGNNGLSNSSRVGTDPYTQSLLAKALLEASAAGPPVPTGTINGGVRELARVDDAGPAATSTGPATAIPLPPGFTVTDHPTIESASRIGLASAALNQNETVLPLSLQEAIARAAMHSLAIRVEGYNPGIKEALVIQAMASFDPTFFANSNWTNTDEPQISPTFANGQSWTHQLGIKQILPTGTQIQASVSATYHDLTLTPGTVLPLKDSWTTDFNLQLTQPLLRGFGSDVNNANIYLAQRDQREALSDFKKQAITSVGNVEEAYLLLVQAHTNVEILQRLVVFSEDTYNLVKARVDLDVTKASLYQAASAVETRRASLLLAQRDYHDASDQLKGLMNDPEFDIRSNSIINPTDIPTTEPLYYNPDDCVMTALQQRPEMQHARLEIERANIAIVVAKNGLLPKLDLIAGLQSNGLNSGLDSALAQAMRPLQYLDMSAGIKLEIPLGNRAAEAQLKHDQLVQKQAITGFMEEAQAVAEDVRKQLRALLSSYAEIQVRDRARVLAAGELESIIDIENIRARTPEFLQLKLDSQGRLADAETALTNAMVNYNLAIMRLEQAKGTLLEFDRISLDRPPLTEADSDANKIRLLGKSYPAK